MAINYKDNLSSDEKSNEKAIQLVYLKQNAGKIEGIKCDLPADQTWQSRYATRCLKKDFSSEGDQMLISALQTILTSLTPTIKDIKLVCQFLTELEKDFVQHTELIGSLKENLECRAFFNK